MPASTRTLATLWLTLALTASGCAPPIATQGDADDDDTSDSSAIPPLDTSPEPPECPRAGHLQLSESDFELSKATVMYPASRGGANHALGSCGGAGVDATYLMTSQKTAYYRLAARADDWVTPLTLHVHAGDSCHGPEIFCQTQVAGFGVIVMLAKGETVTMVVDTDPNLVIPETGLPYNVIVSWAEQPCDLASLNACAVGPSAELQTCMASVSCGDFDAAGVCHMDFAGELGACTAQFCPGGWEACRAACSTRRSSCASACDQNTCMYEWLLCADSCTSCNPAYFVFEFTDTCELPLPGPPGAHVPFVEVNVGDDYVKVGGQGAACGDPSDPGVVWTSDSVMRLCDLACEAFATAGVAHVTYGTPTCE